jgi:hypothetical protein
LALQRQVGRVGVLEAVVRQRHQQRASRVHLIVHFQCCEFFCDFRHTNLHIQNVEV